MIDHFVRWQGDDHEAGPDLLGAPPPNPEHRFREPTQCGPLRRPVGTVATAHLWMRIVCHIPLLLPSKIRGVPFRHDPLDPVEITRLVMTALLTAGPGAPDESALPFGLAARDVDQQPCKLTGSVPLDRYPWERMRR